MMVKTQHKTNFETASHLPGTVVAPMAGLVVKVLVKDGSKHVVKAPFVGYVRGLQVTACQQVSDGSLLFIIKRSTSAVLGQGREVQTRREAWEIDLSKLDIRHVIARGTYGTVYRGNYDGQDVAVKILNWGEDGIATAAEIAALRASFQQEVAVWHKLDHANVTKTENMLLDAHRTLKIADFGVARVEAQNPRDMTGETGTLGYMAPESLTVSHTIGNVMCTALVYAYGKFIAVTCLIPILVLLKFHLKLFDRFVFSYIFISIVAGVDKRPEMDGVVRLLEAIDTSKGGGMIPEDQSTGCSVLVQFVDHDFF
ncbi:hypothetical protein GH714_036910 [Hevea brasiliensis]|uniref:Protein kinase domain-containing protein n=1 Tax=Hevea brasiliensis TaxID=3981 RepID=A0A6A6MQY8_HEVBR|nr:hypothetical protein GH714_036910 [Hevea brasiliensis]